MPMPLLPIDPLQIPGFFARFNAGYRLGAKARMSDKPEEVTEIDCSGVVRYAIYRLGGGKIPDGSWHQDRYFSENGYKVSGKYACFLRDNILRLLYMPAKNGKPGHIAFCLNGRTYESWGGNGPGSRLFTGLSKFQATCKVYVIAQVK